MRYQANLAERLLTLMREVYDDAPTRRALSADQRSHLQSAVYILADYSGHALGRVLSVASTGGAALIRRAIPAVSDMVHMAPTTAQASLYIKYDLDEAGELWFEVSTESRTDRCVAFTTANNAGLNYTLPDSGSSQDALRAFLEPLTPENIVVELFTLGERTFVQASIAPGGEGAPDPRFASAARIRFLAHDSSRINRVGSITVLTDAYAVVERDTEHLSLTAPFPTAADVVAVFEDLPGRVELARQAHIRALRERFANRGGSSAAADRERETRERNERRAASQRRYTEYRDSLTPVEEELIPTLPFVGHGLAASRRWGIEIETGAARAPLATPAGWDRRSDGSLRSAYDGWREVQDFEPYEDDVTEVILARNCSQVHDMSERYDDVRDVFYLVPPEGYVRPDTCDECGEITRRRLIEPQTITHTSKPGDCAEFVSPILTSMHSNGLESLLGGLAGRPITSSAGVHVHVEARDLSNEQIASLLLGYDRIEHLITASYRRERRDFCRLRDVGELLGIVNRVADGRSLSHGERYVTLNLQSLGRHGTVEFRAMGPVYDYDYLIRWAMFCREMVNLAYAGVTPAQWNRVKKWGDLLDLFARYGKEYLRAVAHEAGREVPSAPTLERAPKGTHITAEGEAEVTFEQALELNAEMLNNLAAQFRLTEDSLAIAGRLVGNLGSTLTEV